MRRRLMKLGAALAAFTALAIGGAALASGAQNGTKPAAPPAAVSQSSTTADVERGEKADTDSIQDENGKDDATEQSEAADDEAGEAAESESEVPGDDGPGGWADEPGNPNADTQQQGEH